MMAALTAHPHPELSALLGIRRGVAVAVVLLHALGVAAILQSGEAPVEEGGQTVMVSFLTETSPEPVTPTAVPPPVPQELPPVLATERQVVSEAAPAKPVEPVLAVAPAAPAPVMSSAEVAAPAPSDAVPAAVAPAVTPPSFGAAYLNNPRPAYPMVSRRLGEKGVSLLKVQVSAEGRPQQVMVERSSGFARLDRAAQMAVRDWRFVPAREGDKAVSGWVNVPINWNLEN